METKTFIQVVPDTGLSFKLCWVEGGSFNMGSKDDEREQPVHPVTLPSFYLAEYTVTQALWLAMKCGENPSVFPGSQRPVESVSWYDAATFCNQLSIYCGYAPVYFGDPAYRKPLKYVANQKIEYPDTIPVFFNHTVKGFRLPSEAEWEYSARGGNKSGGFRYVGGDKLDEVGWYKNNSLDETKALGLKLDNELGLYDLSGNVWEWCTDQWHNNYKGAPKNGSPWLGLKEDTFRVLRGGSWSNGPRYCRPSHRGKFHPADRDESVGFRVLLGSPSGS